MNAAQPSFSRSIGRIMSHPRGFDSAYSEKVTPTGPAPTSSIRSDPMSRQMDPFLNSTDICCSSLRFTMDPGRLGSMKPGKAFSRMRFPSARKPSQIALRACANEGKTCQ